MDGLKHLQSSNRKLLDLYSQLFRFQNELITHPFGTGQDLSINSLLKFAPIAEKFQLYADEYKNELTKFQNLLNTVQQTQSKMRQIQLQQQREQQQQQQREQQQREQAQAAKPQKPPTQNHNNNSNNIPSTIKQNGSSMASMPRSTAPRTTAPRTTAPTSMTSPQSKTVPNNVNNMNNTNNTNNTAVTASAYYNTNNTTKNTMNRPSKPPTTRKSAPSAFYTQPSTSSPSPTQSQQSRPTNTNVNTNNVVVNSNKDTFTVSSEPTFTRTYSEPKKVVNTNNNNSNNISAAARNTNNNNNNALTNDNTMDSVYSNDLIASSMSIGYKPRRDVYSENRRQKKAKPMEELSPLQQKQNRRKKKREREKRRKQKKEQLLLQEATPEQQQNMMNIGGGGGVINSNNNNEMDGGHMMNIVDDIDDGFDIEDSKEIQQENYQIEHAETARKAEEHAESARNFQAMIKYDSIIKKKRGTYSYGGNGFDIFDGKEIYTSTMLRFSGINGLREDNEDDKNMVKNVMKKEMKFNDAQIEDVQIRNGRAWCIVYVRASMKFIRDKIKKQVNKNRKIAKQNQEVRQWMRNRSSDDEEDGDGEKRTLKPIYRISEYIRRNNYNDNEDEQNQNKKLYILNFDILNKNCHKALTNLFLKFGDLQSDILIGKNSRDDPYAKVEYKDFNDAKTLWTYQNVNGHPKIQFGKRILTIQYAKY